ncbi:MAG: ROK family protein [Erysipelotrichaceae bacterium]|nr:ROK family protein [Erysipelotrichaceae bacterium]
MNKYIGIDLGGTNVRIALINEEGEVLKEADSPSYAQEGPEKVSGNIEEILSGFAELQECKGIGIGVPGPVDSRRRVMTLATNLPGFKDYPLAERLERKFGIPVFVENDANVAGIGEALAGAGKGCPIVYYVTQSTGIGGALVINGKIHSGAHGYAGEIGNIIIDPHREKISELNAGSAETEASGTALNRKAKALGYGNAAGLFKAAAAGDEKAKELIDTMSCDLARLLSSIALVADPDIIVIGGGVAVHSSELYFPLLKKYYESFIHPGMRDTQIVLAQLKEPGIVGAAMLAKAALQ